MCKNVFKKLIKAVVVSKYKVLVNEVQHVSNQLFNAKCRESFVPGGLKSNLVQTNFQKCFLVLHYKHASLFKK